MGERVRVEIADGVADVRLSRPDKLNALDAAMFEAIAATIADLGSTRGLRAVVLSGEGRGFCAGLDMASMAAAGPFAPLAPPAHGPANLYQQASWGWRTLPVPVIAAAHGVALGGGFQIVAGADIRIAAPGTRFSIMEMKWGLIPDMGGIALWRGLARDDVLRELTYTARTFEAAEALALGLVTRITDDPRRDALAMARDIAGRSPDAVRAAKRLFTRAADGDAAAILAMEAREQAAILGGANQREAVAANLGSRAPRFDD